MSAITSTTSKRSIGVDVDTPCTPSEERTYTVAAEDFRFVSCWKKSSVYKVGDRRAGPMIDVASRTSPGGVM